MDCKASGEGETGGLGGEGFLCLTLNIEAV